MTFSRDKSGQILIEILVAVSIFGFVAAAVISLMAGSYVLSAEGGERLAAQGYAEEGLEAVRSIRQRAWNYLENGSHGLTDASGYWEFLGTQDVLGGKYTRTITIEDVCRNEFNYIVDCAAPYSAVDIHTKKAVSDVQWVTASGIPNVINVSTYLTTWQSSEINVDTTSDFSGRSFILNNTEISNNFGDENGAVIFARIPSGIDWSCVGEVGFENINGQANANAIAYANNYVFIGRGQVLYSYDVTDPANPVYKNELDVGGNINSVAVSGGYAYLATAGNRNELAIVDVSAPSNLSYFGEYNADSGANGLDVFVLGSRAYLVTSRNTTRRANPEFYILDVANPSSPALVSSSSFYNPINANVNGVYVKGNYAYLATSRANREFIVLDISNESNISEADFINFNGGTLRALSGVAVSGNFAYVTTLNGYNRLIKIDISDPNNVFENSILVLGVDTNKVFISGNYAFAAGESGAGEMSIVDISGSAMNLTSSIDFSAPVNDIVVDGNIIYAATDDNNKELVVFRSSAGTTWQCNKQYSGIDLSGSDNATRVFVRELGGQTLAYIAQNAELRVYDVTNSLSPVLQDVFSLASGQIRGLYVYESYAYLATSRNTEELVVVDVSDPANIASAGSYNVDSGANANDVFVIGNRAYLVTNNSGSDEFYALNISDVNNIVLADPNSRYNIGANVQAVQVVGRYAYLATSDNNYELQVLDLGDESNINIVGTYNTSGIQNGSDVYVEGGYVYLLNGNGNTMFILQNAADPPNMLFVGSYNLGARGRALYLSGDFVFAATDAAGRELQIIDVSVKNNPSPSGSFSTGGQKIYDVYRHDGLAYLATAHDSEEVKIIRKKDAVMSFESFGYFYSTIIDLGGMSYIQAASWRETLPDPADCDPGVCKIRLRIFVQRQDNSWVWSPLLSNPSGTVLPADKSYGKAVRFAAYVWGNGSYTPAVNSVTINYR